jgi:hypothetical protein
VSFNVDVVFPLSPTRLLRKLTMSRVQETEMVYPSWDNLWLFDGISVVWWDQCCLVGSVLFGGISVVWWDQCCLVGSVLFGGISVVWWDLILLVFSIVFFFRLSCAQCCLCLWIIHSWLSTRFSLTFINSFCDINNVIS